MDNEFLSVGDLVTHGTYMLYDSPEKTVWITRDGEMMYRTVEWKNVDALLEDNKKAANDFSRSGKLGDLVRIASVPIGIHLQWENEGISDDPIALARRLNDADYSKFRVNSLRV